MSIPTPSREELVRMRETMTRQEIADYFEVALSRVKRWIKDLEVPANTQPNGKAVQKAPQGVPLEADHGVTLVEKAHQILGKRVSRDYRGYLLDGRPVRVDILIRTAGLKVPDVP